MTNGFCIWLNGPAGSGKSTLAGMLDSSLKEKGVDSEILDEDVIGTYLSPDPESQLQDLYHYVRQLMFIADLLVKHQVVAIIAAERPRVNLSRIMPDEFGAPKVDIFLDAPEDACLERRQNKDVKKASNEWPSHPDAVVHTYPEKPEESLERLLSVLTMLKLIERETTDQGFSEEETERIRKQLSELGYM